MGQQSGMTLRQLVDAEDLHEWIPAYSNRTIMRAGGKEMRFRVPWRNDSTPSGDAGHTAWRDYGDFSKRGDLVNFHNLIGISTAETARMLETKYRPIKIAKQAMFYEGVGVESSQSFKEIATIGHARLDTAMPYFEKRGISREVANNMQFGYLPKYNIGIHLPVDGELKLVGYIPASVYVLPNLIGWYERAHYRGIQYRYDIDGVRASVTEMAQMESSLIAKMYDFLGDGTTLEDIVQFTVGHRFTSAKGSKLMIYGANTLLGRNENYPILPYLILCEGPIPTAVGLSAGWKTIGVPFSRKIDIKLALKQVRKVICAFDKNQAGYDRLKWIREQLADRLNASPPDVEVIEMPFSSPTIQYDDAVLNGEVEAFMHQYGFLPNIEQCAKTALF